MKPTPGPWQKLKGGPDWSPVIGSDARLVAQPHPRDSDLIAAAPDLLAALKEFTEGRNNAHAMDMAHAAIAKAEGRG